MGELRRTAIHRVLYRPNLVLGCERELFLVTSLVAAGLVVTGLNLPSLLGGAVVWGVAITALRMMAQADPMMSRVYRRHIRYARYYAPRSRPWRKD